MGDAGSLYVSLGLQDTGFQAGIRRANSELRNLKSGFQLAGAGNDKFGKSLEGIRAKADYLNRSIDVQSRKVDQYRDRLTRSTETLDRNKTKHQELGTRLEETRRTYETVSRATGENSEQSRELAEELQNLENEYRDQEEVLRNNINTATNYETQLNRVEGELRDMQSELSNTNRELEVQSSRWTQAGERLTAFGDRAQKIGKGMQGAGKTMMAGVTAPLVAIGGLSLKTAIDFESAMSEVGAISGATGTDLQKLEDKAREMGKKTSKSAKEAAEALKYMSLAGWDVEQSMAGLEPVLRLSEAGNIDLGRASDLVTDSMAALGLQVKDLDGYLDKVAQTQSKANTNADAMLEAYVISGGVFKNLNTDLDTSAALIGILANRGIKGANAGNALNSTMVNLSGSTDKTKKIFKELGVEIYDQQGKYIGVDNVLLKLEERFKGMTEEQRNYYLAQLVGKSQIDTMNALLSGMGDEYQSLKKDIEGADGALLRVAETMQDNLKGDITKLKSNLEEMGIKIGTILIPMAKDLVEVLNKWVDKFSDLSPKTQENIVKFGILAAAIGPVLYGVGTLTVGIGTLAKGFGIVSTFIGGLSGAGGLASVGAGATAAVGTAGSGIGIAGLAGTLGGFAVAAAPYLLAIGAVAGTGYLVKKAMTKEAIPAVDLFADKIESHSATITTQTDAMGTAMETTATKISEGTKEAVGAYVDLDDKSREAMNNLYINGTTITGQLVTDTTALYEQMGQQVNSQLEADKNKEIETLKKFFNDNMSLSEEEKAKMIEDTNKHYEEKQKLTNEGNAKIQEILNNASQQRRALTSEEKTEINRIQDEQRVNAVKILSEQEIEANVILERMKAYDARITAEQASEHIKILNKQRDDAIKVAHEEYNGRIESIVRMRDESKTISADQASALIEDAKRQRDGIIARAEETRDGAVSKIASMNSELKDSVDLTTGKILNQWDKLKNWWNGWKPGSKTFSTVHINELVTKHTEQGSPRLKQTPSWNIRNNWTGNDNFQGGLTYLGEKGRELLIYPNGNVDLTQDTTELRNLPKGTKILKNSDTEKVLGGRGHKIPGFAKGNVNLTTNDNDLMKLMNGINNILQEVKNFNVKQETVITKTNRQIEEVRHSGTITVKGINDKGQFVDSVELVVKDILRRERRT